MSTEELEKLKKELEKKLKAAEGQVREAKMFTKVKASHLSDLSGALTDVYDMGEKLERVRGTIDLARDLKESALMTSELIMEAQNLLSSVLSSLEKINGKIDHVINEILADLKDRAQTRDLEKETLEKINQYLNRWT